MSTILDEIVATKRLEIAADRRRVPESSLVEDARNAPQPRDFLAALASGPPIRLIAEIKKASPSRGVIRDDFEPLEIARLYQQHGASCLSVLTDSHYFQGSLEILRKVRATVELPVLRKDFILDTYQVIEARAAGADAVLLIAECLEPDQLETLYHSILQWGMTPLVEVYEPDNLARVVQLDAKLIGINNRDLRTFKTDLQHTIRLRGKLPAECLVVSESGVHSRSDVQVLQAAGVNAMLVGERLMASPDIGRAVDLLLGTGR